MSNDLQKAETRNSPLEGGAGTFVGSRVLSLTPKVEGVECEPIDERRGVLA